MRTMSGTNLFSDRKERQTLVIAQYRVTHLLGNNLPLTWIWDVPPTCLGRRQLKQRPTICQNCQNQVNGRFLLSRYVTLYSSGLPVGGTPQIQVNNGFYCSHESPCTTLVKVRAAFIERHQGIEWQSVLKHLCYASMTSLLLILVQCW